MYLCKLPLSTIQNYLSGKLFKFDPLDSYDLITLNYPQLLNTMAKYDNALRPHEYAGSLYRDLPDCTNYLRLETVDCYDNFIQDSYQLLINRGIKVIGHYDYRVPNLLEIKANFMEGYIYTYLGGSDSALGINKLYERTVHDYHHIIENQLFDCNGEYCVTIAVMRLVKAYALENNYDEGVAYQVQQLVWSEIYMQAAYYYTFKAFPQKQKIVLVSIPNLG
jgi:hypothetical protein